MSIDNPSTLHEVPFGTSVADKPQSVFVAVTVTCALWKGDTNIPANVRDEAWPFVFLFLRWDGRIGFLGGFLEKDEHLRHRAMREAREEGNFVLSELGLIPICTHANDHNVMHLYQYDLGDVDLDTLRKYVRLTQKGKHTITEGTVFLAPLGTYPKGKGLPIILRSNQLATAVREELIALCKAMKIPVPV